MLLMDSVFTKSFMFITRAFVKSLFIVANLNIKFIQTVLLLMDHILAFDITACQKILKNNKKQLELSLDRMFDAIQLLTWSAIGFMRNFLPKAHADSFALLGLFALMAWVKVLLTPLIS